MKQKNKWRFIPLTTAILSGGRLALEGLLRLLAFASLMRPARTGEIHWNRGSAASVGIIGGADGPTAIFVTSNEDNTGLILAAVGFVVSIFVYIYLRKNELHNDQ